MSEKKSPGARRVEDPEQSSGASRPSTRDDVNVSRGEEKDQGFGASHGYPPGHGGPTSPGDAPAKGAPATPKRDDGREAQDATRRDSTTDGEADRR